VCRSVAFSAAAAGSRVGRMAAVVQRSAGPAHAATLNTSAATTSSAGRSNTTGGATVAWDGAASQDELMHKDCCAVVDDRDTVTGHGSKWAVHRFEGATPDGTLHRAFSAFVFDAAGRLLLQQRATSKITFPGVWTNTCCSHPLVGYSPTEIDTPDDVAAGRAPGAVRAAIRKLGHELGIPADELPHHGFKFLTRLHYCARDSHTHGPQSPWGEHEMDYILLCRVPHALHVAPNPEEVGDVRWVTLEQLTDMMRPETGLLWSPWFRIIAQRFLPTWWADLDVTLNTDKHVDAATIHKVL
jgi:isopentenyl-diphosphate delta-isomerase type 1